jgi:arylsulfatase A-like enzyme
VGDVPDSPLNSENDPLRGQKNTLWEGGVRVCAFANWPGVLAPRKCPAVIHAADWFPTLAGLLELQEGQSLGWDGIDRWAAITDSGAAARPKPLCIVHASGRAVYESDRDGDWKLIVRKKEPAALYDLAADPFETKNLAAEQPAVVERLTAIAAADAARDVTDLPADLRDTPH